MGLLVRIVVGAWGLLDCGWGLGPLCWGCGWGLRKSSGLGFELMLWLGLGLSLEDGVAFELYWAEFNHDDIIRKTVGGSV